MTNRPALLRDGNVIKEGFNEEIDNLRIAMRDGKKWLAALENEERESTGISKLKVGYNKVFGYYIEITKSAIKDVPDYYIRKQTLANCERYITPKLKEIENTILGASEKIVTLESYVFEQVRTSVSEEIERLKMRHILLQRLTYFCRWHRLHTKTTLLCLKYRITAKSKLRTDDTLLLRKCQKIRCLYRMTLF